MTISKITQRATVLTIPVLALGAVLPAAQAATASTDTSATVHPLGSIILDTDFVDANFAGASENWTGDESCLDESYGVPSMPAAFNNDITSFETFANCEANHWSSVNYGGTESGYQGTTANIGATMNDKTESEAFA